MRRNFLTIARSVLARRLRSGARLALLGVSLILATATAGAQSQEPIDTIKIDTNLISVPVIVSDRDNHYVPNLKVEAFRLLDNQAEQKIAFFDAGEEPLNVVLMLDTSLSTSGVLDDIRKAAKAFLKELRPQDRAMIVTFDWQEQKLSPLTSNRKELESGIKQARVGKMAGTVLYDSLTDVNTRVLQPIRGRKAIILLSDGNDHGSALTAEETLKSESEADAMIYSIYYRPEAIRFLGRPHYPLMQMPGRRGRGRRPFGTEGFDVMQQLSEVTGGRFYQGETKDLKDTFTLIAEELRHQYRLGFYPDELKRDGSVHALQVKVNLPDLSVRSRREYVAK
ncbi:MAG TPA: VWA domain-containing protein [Pyrinomonadaceae bacterium]|nr:VWA domain-containing protein [Pyrinomonadaceae bacterium]